VTAPFSQLIDQEVFAVDERSAQLVVRASTEHVSVDIDGRNVQALAPSGVAVVEIDDLAADTAYEAVLSDAEGRSLGELALRTKPTNGTVLSRFATISDVHLGAAKFGPARSITDDFDVPYAFRCARAAIDEAAAWGAEVLLIKGDLTDTGAEEEWDQAQRLFAESPLPFLFTPGNHDQWHTRELDPSAGAQLLGVPSDAVQSHDLDGVRLVLADTSKPDKGTGDLARLEAPLLDIVNVERPVFLGLHHNIQRAPLPWFWPPGTPSTNANPVIDALHAVNSAMFVSSGHTHRNRRHQIGPAGAVTYTEVSATADYPGCWAGYEVTESAIRQTVRRIASPAATSWTESTRAALGGIWPRWSQGRLDDRCVDAQVVTP